MEKVNTLWNKVYTLVMPYTTLMIYELNEGGFFMTLNGVLTQHRFNCTLEEAKDCAEEIIFTEYIRIIETIRKKHETETAGSDSKDDSIDVSGSEVQPEGRPVPQDDGGHEKSGVLHPPCDGTCPSCKHGEKSEGFDSVRNPSN